MPSFERLHRSLMLHVHSGDPVMQEKLQYGFKQRDRGRLEIAALFLIVYILFVVALQVVGGTACRPDMALAGRCLQARSTSEVPQ